MTGAHALGGFLGLKIVGLGKIAYICIRKRCAVTPVFQTSSAFITQTNRDIQLSMSTVAKDMKVDFYSRIYTSE